MKRIILLILALMISLSAMSAQAAGGGQEKLLAENLRSFSDGIHASQNLTIKMWVGSDLIPFPCRPVGLVDLNGDGNRELLALAVDLSAGSGTLMIWSADSGEAENVLYLPDATMTYEESTSDLTMYFIRDGSSIIEYETMDGWGAVRLASDGNRIAITDMLTREDDGLQGETDVCTRNGDFIDVSEYKVLVSGWQNERTETICAFPWPEKNCFGFGYTWEEALDALENGTGSGPVQTAPDSRAGNETGNAPDPAAANNPQAETGAASGTEEVEVDPRVSRIFTSYECGCTDSSYGVMVSRNGLVTRAVTIYCPKHGKKFSRLEFFFGFVNDDLFAARYDGDFSFTAYEQFKNGYEKENDIAFIHFAEPVGDETGWYACKAASDKELKKAHLVLRLDTVRGRIQADAPSVKVLNKKFLSYTYMKGTASGVPALIEDENGNRTVIGICTAYDPEENVGYIRRITSRVYNDMKSDGIFKGCDASSAPSVTRLSMPEPTPEHEPDAGSDNAQGTMPAQPPQADGNGWICQGCGTEGNTGNFCINCGMPKTEAPGTSTGQEDTEPEDEQDAYWTGSGRETLWNALNTGNPQPLSDEEKKTFFAQYAADMKLADREAGEGISGSFAIRADGTFRTEYKSSFEGETEEYLGSGSFVNVYRLSNWVYALEPGEIRWDGDENEFLVQNQMLFEIPGAAENDSGILKYELQSIAEQNGLNPAEPVPYCFITAFDSAPLWYGQTADTGKTPVESNAPADTAPNTVLLLPETTDSGTWTCPACGQEGNAGNFCIHCGAAKPAEEWTCPNCGQEHNAGNFCIHCGAAKPAAEWTCPNCGQAGNDGNFCIHCGAEKPVAE